MSFLNKVTRFARSPQGKKAVRQAQTFASSPEGKKKIASLRSRFGDGAKKK